MTCALRWLLVAVVLVGCDRAGPTNEDPEYRSGLNEDATIEVAGEDRSFHLYVPSAPSNASIVILLHGNRASNDDVLGLSGVKAPYKVWLDLAKSNNLLLVVPNGNLGPNGHQGWNDCRTDAPGNPDSDDVRFLSQLIDSLVNTFETRATKAFIVGTSNGGHMAMRLAHEAPGKLEGFAAIAASNPVNSACSGSDIAVPALIMNGTADPILPYEGGLMESDRGEVRSTTETIAYWVARNRASETAVETVFPDSDSGDQSTIVRHLYNGGPTGSDVAHFEVVDGGHTEPSVAERYGNLFKLVVGNQNGDIEMANEAWAFFDSVRDD